MADKTAADPSPGICLLTPDTLTREAVSGVIAAALDHAAVEVLVLTAATQANGNKRAEKDLRALALRHGKVFLVEEDAERAVALEADGTLMGTPGGIARTRKTIGREAMVGVATGITRQAAMEAGEAGADFVGLQADEATEAGMQQLVDHVDWWAELFEIPSVAFGATTLADAQRLLDAGSDFLAMGEPFWSEGTMLATLNALSMGEAPSP